MKHEHDFVPLPDDDDPLAFWRGLGWALIITAGMVLVVAAILQLWF